MTPDRMTFPAWDRKWPDLPGHVRAELFRYLPREEQQEAWDDLGERCRLRIESELLYERRLREPWCPECRGRDHEPPCPARHQPTRRSTAATPTRPGSVELATDDPLKRVAPRVYVEALCGVVVPANGWLHCPLPDHDERTPSFQVLSSHWRCFGCGRGGSVIDLAAAIYGIAPRGRGYWELRDLIVEALEGAPHNLEEDR